MTHFKKLNRSVHYWGAIACAIPILIVIGSGVLLLLKKESDWIQPSAMRGEGGVPTLSFEAVLPILQNLKEISVINWQDIKRIDVRPKKGIMKVQTQENWEVQIDHQTGDVLQVAFRRSDIIESIHDGTFFHGSAKLWVFLPAALILFVLWITGIYLFVITEMAKHRSRKKPRVSKQ